MQDIPSVKVSVVLREEFPGIGTKNGEMILEKTPFVQLSDFEEYFPLGFFWGEKDENNS